MANADRPAGLTPVGTLGSAGYVGKVRRMYIAAGYGTALFVGDPVKVSGTGDTLGVPGIEAAGASGVCVGVIVGFESNKADLTKLHSAASTEGYALVDVDPNTIYKIQDDNNTAMTVADIGLNADFIAGAGDATTGRSAYELDSGGTTAPGTTATLAVQIIGVDQRPDNDVTVGNCDWLVRLNGPEYVSTTGV